MDKLVQAKCISDEQIVLAVHNLGEDATRANICDMFPNVPRKVVAAKIRQATLKGKLYGCESDICARVGRCRFQCSPGYRVVVD